MPAGPIESQKAWRSGVASQLSQHPQLHQLPRQFSVSEIMFTNVLAFILAPLMFIAFVLLIAAVPIAIGSLICTATVLTDNSYSQQLGYHQEALF
jgi:hypothetical protein